MGFFDNFYRVVGTAMAKLVLAEFRNIHKQLRRIQMTLKERFDAVNEKLDEAKREIMAEIEKLKNESLTAEGAAALERLESAANDMANISPDAEPPAA